MANVLLFNADVGATLQFTILKGDGTPYDITGDTVTLLVEGIDEFACSVIDGPTGRADYVVAANDFQPGTYRAQIKTVVGGVTLHSPHFHIQVGQVVDTTPVVTASIAPAEGAIPFGAIGGGAFTTDATNLSWDDANNNLRLFAGTVGTGGVKVIAIGAGTAPTTSPVDTAQLWTADIAGAGTAGLQTMLESTDVIDIGGIIARAVDPTSVTNTVTETTVFTHTVQGGTLGTKRALRFSAYGTYTNNTGANRTVTFRVKYDNTTLYSHISGNLATNAAARVWSIQGFLSPINSTSSQDSFFRSTIGAVNSHSGVGSTPTEDFVAMVLNGGAEDDTTDLAVTLTIQHSNADTTATCRAAYLEVL